MKRFNLTTLRAAFSIGQKILPIVLTLLLVAPVYAANYYMATTANGGSDSNPGTLSQPFATLAKFNSIAQPGDILYIRGGIYYPAETFITKSGTATSPITIRNYEGETPIFDGQRDNASSGTNAIVLDDGVYSGVDGAKHHIIFDGLVLRNWKRGGFYLGDTNSSRAQTYISVHNIIIRNCVIDYCGQLGIRVTHGDYIEISNCMVSRTGWDINYGSWSSNINLYNCPGKNLVVRNCVSYHAVDISSYHTDGNGMILDMYDAYEVDGGATVENCVMFENGGAGIAWTRQSNANINNNTLYNNALEENYIYDNVGLALWRESGQGNFTNINIRNNIVYQPNSSVAAYRVLSYTSSGNVDVVPASGTVANNNFTGLAGGQDPQMTDPNNLDFSLKSTSPMINAGTSSNVPTSALNFRRSSIKSQTTGQPHSTFRWAPDFDYISNNGGVAAMFIGASRSGTPDIGAFEYAGATGGTQSPYGGTARNVPGTIQAEDYDNGGQDVAFSDSDGSNNGGQYRTDAVDIEACSEGGFNVGWSASNEWLEYTVNVQNAGTYKVNFRVASANGGGNLTATFSGNNASTGAVSFAATGGWQTWTTTSSGNITLAAGIQVMRVTMGGANINLNSIQLESVGSTSGNPIVVRARGTAGSEQIRLLLGGSTVQTWTLTTSYADYSYTPTGAPGNTKVEFFNDASGRDVQVDYITYNGTTYQAESQASNTGVWQNQCGGSYSEMMHCNGTIDFGTIGGTSETSHLLYSDQLDNSWTDGSWGATINNGATAQVKVGSKSTAVQFTQAWGAWRLLRATNQSTSGYTSLKFWAYGASGGNNLQIVVKKDGTESGRKSVAVSAGAWNEYTVNLSDVGNPTEIDELWIHDGAGGSQNVFYVDQLRLTSSSGGAGARQAASHQEQIQDLEETDAEELAIYPNPGKEADFLFFSFKSAPGPIKVNIRDQNGSVLVSENFDGQNQRIQMKLPHLANGFYLLQVQGNKSVWIKKYIVNK